MNLQQFDGTHNMSIVTEPKRFHELKFAIKKAVVAYIDSVHLQQGSSTYLSFKMGNPSSRFQNVMRIARERHFESQ